MLNRCKVTGSNVSCKIVLMALAVMLLSAVNLFAEKAATDEMDRVCRNWLTATIDQKGQWNGDPSPAVREAEDIMVDGLKVGRIYHIEPSGFVVVPILKEMPAVAFHSTESNLDIKADDGLADVIKGL